ncbi:MAG: IS1380 family transposase [Candidatus Eisenbacteria bacterium]|nr:IS1380 family transposase [Candidatus Eisenbacteria bacterium]
MIRQTVLPFKLKRTEERITARSGLALYAEFIQAMKVETLIDRHFPRPGSGRGFSAGAYVMPLTLMQYGGGAAIDDIGEIRDDQTLREAICLKTIPTSAAIGDWLRRMGGRDGIDTMEQVNDELIRAILKKDSRTGYTLIIDPTIIEAEKRDAHMTYLGFKGYRPVVATLKENGLAISYEFKEGNDNGGKLATVKKAFGKLPAGKQIEETLLDAEYYETDILAYLEANCKRWAVGADKDEAVKALIGAIPAYSWRPYKNREGDATDREIAEVVHAMQQGKVVFRLIVLRWKERQGDLFTDTWCYHAIAASMTDERPAEEVVWSYNARAHIENHIKELKNGFGMGQMPSGDFGANAVYFGIGVMTYNLFLAQKILTMPEAWRTKTIKSIRWMLVEVAGKLVRGGRRIVLKIAASIEKYAVYLEIRRRTYELMRA